MWVLYLEMLFALIVIIFIMVWTLRARVDPPEVEPEENSPSNAVSSGTAEPDADARDKNA